MLAKSSPGIDRRRSMRDLTFFLLMITKSLELSSDTDKARQDDLAAASNNKKKDSTPRTQSPRNPCKCNPTQARRPD